MTGGQNTSHAVMAQRTEARDSLDDFPTPPWATRAMCEYLLPDDIMSDECEDPCANRGFMVRGLQGYFASVSGADVRDYGAGFPVKDFLFPGQRPAVPWMAINPPFKLAGQFIARALDLTSRGVAVFVRAGFLEGVGRYNNLYSVRPPTIVAHFAERVILAKGKMLDPDVKCVWDKKKKRWKKPSTATAYIWLLWIHGEDPRPPQWIKPCRKLLTAAGDYDPPPAR